MDEPTTRGLGGEPPAGVTDVRPTPMTPARSTGPRSLLVSAILAALVAFGVWSAVGQGDDDVFWPGVVIGALALVLVAVRVTIRRAIESGGAGVATRVASGEQLDVAGVPMFISAFARAATKRNSRWNGGVTTTGRLLGILSLGRSNQFSSSVYLEIEYEVGGRRYWGAAGESVLHANAGALRPDGEVVVRVDPDHPARVAIDWTQTMRAPDAR